jgi:hypothetical protein
MPDKIQEILRLMRENPRNVRFRDLSRLCERYFGPPRQTGGSHRIFKTPWAGDPRINIQEGKQGSAKLFQIKQVLAAIDKIEKAGKT